MRIDLDQQPVDQGLVLRLAALAHEVLAQVPVGGVEDAHEDTGALAMWPIVASPQSRQHGGGRIARLPPIYLGSGAGLCRLRGGHRRHPLQSPHVGRNNQQHAQ